MDSNRDRYDRADRPEVPTGDWRSGPRSDLPEQRNRNGGGGFSRDRDRDGGEYILQYILFVVFF